MPEIAQTYALAQGSPQESRVSAIGAITACTPTISAGRSQKYAPRGAPHRISAPVFQSSARDSCTPCATERAWRTPGRVGIRQHPPDCPWPRTRATFTRKRAFLSAAQKSVYDDGVSLEHRLLYHQWSLSVFRIRSGDIRELQTATMIPEQKLAFDYFVYAIVKYTTTSPSVLMDWMRSSLRRDQENSAPFVLPFARSSTGLAISLDEAQNKKNGPRISAPTAVFRCGSFPPMKS